MQFFQFLKLEKNLHSGKMKYNCMFTAHGLYRGQIDDRYQDLASRILIPGVIKAYKWFNRCSLDESDVLKIIEHAIKKDLIHINTRKRIACSQVHCDMMVKIFERN